MLRHSRVVAGRFILPLLFALSVGTGYRWASAAGPLDGPGEGPSLNCRTMPRLMHSFLYNHVKNRVLDDELKKRTVDEFIKHMDPSKTLLFEAEVKTLQKELMGVYDAMEAGDCSLLEKLNAKTVERSAGVETFVKAMVGKKDYKVDETVEFVLDTDKRATPKDETERNAILTKLVHFQIATYLASDEKLEDAKKLLTHRYELLTRRIKERKSEDLYDSFVSSFAAALDPHSSYLSPDVLEDFNIGMKLSLEGIGVLLSSQDGYTVVEEIIPGGATDRAKALKPKDKVISVQQKGQKPVDIVDMALRDVVRMIRGKKGTPVILSILRGGAKTERLEVTILRDKINLQDQAAKLTFETREVGTRKLKLAVIDLPSFYGDQSLREASSYRDMRKLLEKAGKSKADGVMLDLSRNGGGLLDEAVRISGLFIRRGGVVAVKNSKSKVDILEDQNEDIAYSGPLVVLTSRLSASASEILAGALKDYKRALIVGDDHTFGKGTVQAVLSLPPQLGALKVTTSMFFLPGGESTQRLGVKSDVVVPSAYSTEEFGETALPNNLPNDHITPFVYEDNASYQDGKSWKQISTPLVTKLSERSSKRIAGNEEFKKVQEQLKKAEENKGVVRLADVLKEQADNKKKKPDSSKSAKEREKQERGPQYAEALNVLGDLVADTVDVADKTPVADTSPAPSPN